MDLTKVKWVTSDSTTRRSLKPAIRIGRSGQIWFNKAAWPLVRYVHRMLLGYDDHCLYMKPASSSDFGFLVKRIKPTGNYNARRITINALAFVKETGIKLPVTVPIRKEDNVIVGELPKKEH